MLTISNLTVEFEGVGPVAKSISLKVNKGESVGLVGESGSGKSITSLAVMGLLPPAAKVSGSILFSKEDGTEVELCVADKNYPQRVRGREIAMIFQEPMTALNPTIRCGEQVDEMTRENLGLNSREAKAKTLQLFGEVLLPDPEKAYRSYPHELSGGQRQRVMIAMAISCKPQLLIADEPTTALDVTVQKEILELLKSLKNRYGMALIFISHDLRIVSEVCDRIVVMRRGDMVEEGSSTNIFHHPQQPYTKALISCLPPINYRPERLLTVKEFTEQESPSIILQTDEARQNQHHQLYQQAPILSVKDLYAGYSFGGSLFSKTRKLFKAVKNVHFDVYPCETFGLVGESGCGKTSLGRTLVGLVKSLSGSIEFEGKRIDKLAGEELRLMRRHIQMIFQDPFSSLNPKITVGEAILEPMRVHGVGKNEAERKERMNHLLKKVGLPAEVANRYPHEFSGGQRQRIVIARTLALEPKLVICDESVSALDVSVQAQVLNLLNDLKQELGLTYIFISHDLSVVRYMSDRIMVMQKGELVELNEADELYRHPQKAYTKQLIGAIPKSS
ncbi:ABC transporter ATP-binding protein [Alistipes sp. ZOR0009]|uniref:ABC transporter ATP-binding protein n=1 Tax=Alistipes sp. ZOR0009 TaxID=1339253 RepID=UPI00064599EB|nr:ABC transporter ATP-binding protein [Alistipes sp. ZOR0009]